VDPVEEFTGHWDYKELPSNVRLGEGCYIERKDAFGRFFSRRDPGLVIGDRVRAYTWTSFSVEPEGLMEIGDDCVLVGAVFMCADSIKVGNRVLMSYYVSVADCDFHPMDPELRKQDAVANSPSAAGSLRPSLDARPVVIEDDVQIGIGAIILKGTHIGRGARVGAGSVVTSDVPAGALVGGNPARVLEMLDP